MGEGKAFTCDDLVEFIFFKGDRHPSLADIDEAAGHKNHFLKAVINKDVFVSYNLHEQIYIIYDDAAGNILCISAVYSSRAHTTTPCCVIYACCESYAN